jgi:ribonuclease E
VTAAAAAPALAEPASAGATADDPASLDHAPDMTPQAAAGAPPDGEGEGRGGRRRRRGRRGRRGGAGRDAGPAGTAGETSEPTGSDDLDEGFDDGADAERAATPGDAQDAAPQSVLDLVPPPPRDAAAGISWTGLAPAEPAPQTAPLTQEPDAAPVDTAPVDTAPVEAAAQEAVEPVAAVAAPETAPETAASADPSTAPEAAPEAAKPAAAEPTRVVWSSSPTSYGPSSSGSSRRDDY